MAATFVVETGAGLTNSNSYVSEAEADQYHDNFGAPTAWTGASSDAKQAALRDATRYVDSMFKRRWVGFKLNRDQALDWPRLDAVDCNGFALDTDSVPQSLKDAVSDLALRSIQGTVLLADEGTSDDNIRREKVKVGPIEEDITYSPAKETQQKFKMSESLLACLLKGSGGASGTLERS